MAEVQARKVVGRCIDTLSLPIVAFEGRESLTIVGDVGSSTSGAGTGVREGVLQVTD